MIRSEKIKNENNNNNDNNSDIGTKRVSLPIFNKLLNQIIDQSQRRNL